MGLHAFTWCDTTSCFKGFQKVKLTKLLDKNDHFELLLSQIGSSFSVSADLEVELEVFVCLLNSWKHHKEPINWGHQFYKRNVGEIRLKYNQHSVWEVFEVF